ncbi:hypothetical protein V1477_001234 [Vespula maculifrons]|uniref:Uncharacterized protein n=1 Tax=Vespula maculifrons TaxID=7453 RepID=A0ABD2CZ72_VESMC
MYKIHPKRIGWQERKMKKISWLVSYDRSSSFFRSNLETTISSSRLSLVEQRNKNLGVSDKRKERKRLAKEIFLRESQLKRGI